MRRLLIPLYALAAAVLCLAPLAPPLPPLASLRPTLNELLVQGQVPNLVATVILHTRLYDTIAEVVVFTLASIGVRYLLAGVATLAAAFAKVGAGV